MSLRRRSIVLALAAAVAALASVSAQAATVKIVIDKLVYAPKEAQASVGDTIEWVNNDVLVHTATARNHDWDVMIPAKKTVTLVLKKSGTIDYFCRFHPNMTGRLVVTPK